MNRTEALTAGISQGEMLIGLLGMMAGIMILGMIIYAIYNMIR